MEQIVEIVKHVFIGSSDCADDEDVLKEREIKYLLGVYRSHTKRSRQLQSGFIHGAKTVVIYDTLLEHVADCNDFIHHCRLHHHNILVYSPTAVSLSSVFLMLYLKTVSDYRTLDIARLLAVVRPDHVIREHRIEWSHYCRKRRIWQKEQRRLRHVWGAGNLMLKNCDLAIIMQLETDAIKNRLGPDDDGHFAEHQSFLSRKALLEFKDGLRHREPAKRHTLQQLEQEQRKQQQQQQQQQQHQSNAGQQGKPAAPSSFHSKLTYDSHEFDEAIFGNERIVDAYRLASDGSLAGSKVAGPTG